MNLLDMDGAQRQRVGIAARSCAIGTVLGAFYPLHWLIGILGFMLVAIRARQLRDLPGFDWVQWFASLCAIGALVSRALSGIWLISWLLAMVLPVLQLLLIDRLRRAFGRMCPDGNRAGLCALCAAILCTALAVASNLLVLGALGGMQWKIYMAAQAISFGLGVLAALLLAVCLLLKLRKSKEDIE